MLAYFTKPITIHIYHDRASMPTFLQSIDFIKKSKNEQKIVFWNRINKHIKDREKYSNTFFAFHYDEIMMKINEILKKHKNAQAILHFNIHHSYILRDIRKEFPKLKIKELHMYEDASQYVWYHTGGDNCLLNQELNAKKTLYMWGNVNHLCNKENPHKRCPFIQKIQKYINIKEIDIQKLASSLSEDEKKKIFELQGVDYQYYKNNLKDKKTAIYVLAYTSTSPLQSAQLVALKDMCEKYSDHQWFYKYHPNGVLKPHHQVLNKLCPNIKPLEAHIPFELLNLTNENIKVAGMGSSLFYNQKNKNIIAYIQQGDNDLYLPMLKRVGLVTKNNLYSMDIVNKKLKELNALKIVYPNYTIETIQFTNDTYTNIYGGTDYKILERDENTIKLQDSVEPKRIFTIKRQPHNFWKEE